MEASAYFWSAACKALGLGGGMVVLWGSAGGVLHAARSRAAPGLGGSRRGLRGELSGRVVAGALEGFLGH